MNFFSNFFLHLVSVYSRLLFDSTGSQDSEDEESDEEEYDEEEDEDEDEEDDDEEDDEDAEGDGDDEEELGTAALLGPPIEDDEDDGKYTIVLI